MKIYPQKINRGDIIFIKDLNTAIGSEQHGGRPAIVVSNDKCNEHSPVIEVVYLTTAQKKSRQPTHVEVSESRRPSTALCEAVYSIDKRRLAKLIGMASRNTMEKIDRALLISLGIDGPEPSAAAA